MANTAQAQQRRGNSAQGGGMQKRSRATLLSLNDVAEQMAKVYRRAERGDIPWNDATKAVFVLSSLGKVLTEIQAQNKPLLGLIDASGNVIEPPTLADLYGALGAAMAEAQAVGEHANNQLTP